MSWDRHYRLDLSLVECADAEKAIRATRQAATRWGGRVEAYRVGIYPAPDRMHAEIEDLKREVCKPSQARDAGGSGS